MYGRKAKIETTKDVFDFEKLEKTFSIVCPDYVSEPNWATPTMSRRFAEKVIFDFSKDAILAKSKKTDKMWTIRFKNREASKKTKQNDFKVIISTYFGKPSPIQQPTILHGILQLTFKQASLLAVAKYCQLVPYLVARGDITLTPLAGAVFYKENIPKIADELAKLTGQPIEVSDVLNSIISSCQTDGYHLQHSCAHIAVVAISNSVSDFKQRMSITQKTVKQYLRQGKDFDMDKFKIYEKYVNKRVDIKQLVSSASSSDKELNDLVARIMKETFRKETTNDDDQGAAGTSKSLSANFVGKSKASCNKKTTSNVDDDDNTETDSESENDDDDSDDSESDNETETICFK